MVALPEWLDQAPVSPDHAAGSFDCYPVSEKELRQLSALSTPNQVIAYLEYWTPDWVPERCRRGYSLFLDGVQDPGNVGTLLRIADWFGLPYVFGSPDSADFFHPKVIQASMGAFLRVSHQRRELSDILGDTGPMPVLGASPEGRSVFEGPWPDAGLLVLGREGSGIRAETEARVSERVSIPGQGQAESLNAAVAGGILVAQLLYGKGTPTRQAMPNQ